MIMQGLDRHITGNWGEDSVPPEFFRARDLGDLDPGTVIDVTPEPMDSKPIAVTVRSAELRDGNWVVKTDELAFALLIPANGERIYFADRPGEER